MLNKLYIISVDTPQGSTDQRGVQGANGLRGVAGIQSPLGVQ